MPGIVLGEKETQTYHAGPLYQGNEFQDPADTREAILLLERAVWRRGGFESQKRWCFS